MFSDSPKSTSPQGKWEAGFGVIKHKAETKKHIESLLPNLNLKKDDAYKMLAAADRLANAAMWLAVNQVYAKNIYSDGRVLKKNDFKADPQGHMGSALNIIPAYVGYILANSLMGITRGWVMEQGHAVSGIDSVNLLLGNMTKAHSSRYSLTDKGLSLFARDFYSYRLGKDGRQDSPLGSHVNVNTAGGIMEGGYLGFAALQYVHMPLAGERLVAFLSDGAFEEQKGSDWAPRWWRAEDSGLVAPIMIANGRRIDQRSTMDQEGGAKWFADYLRLHDFDPIIFDGRDPAAFAWTIIEQEMRLAQNAANISDIAHYKIKIPYGIAVAPKGAGFYNEGTNYAHNLPLVTNPSKDEVAMERFNIHAAKLYVAPDEIKDAVKLLNNHKENNRVLERDNPLANRDVALKNSAKLRWKTPSKNRMDLSGSKSPMDAIDLGFLMTVKANPHLRPRVGNPDEMLSNKMDDTLDELKFRVVEAEGGAQESTLGNVITALNEEAVAAAAFGNKGGLNIVVTYEAFGAKMFGEARQEVIFSKHCKDAGKPAKWLSVPMVMTSNTWENSKNELSHQDPSLAESMLSETSDISRVIFPADYNSAMAVMQGVYKTQGQIWTVVVPKQNIPVIFSQKEAEQLMHDGAINIEWAGYKQKTAKKAIIAIGAYQLVEALKASKELAAKKIPHMVIYISEPGRFRNPRNISEQQHLAKNAVIKALFPARISKIILMTHTRPELIVGMLQPLLLGKDYKALGFINEGGTLNVDGMLAVNGCSWRDVVANLKIL